MVGRSFNALWKVALALMVLKWLTDLMRDGQSALALVAVIIPISIVMLVRARGSGRRIAPVGGTNAEQSSAVFRQLSKPDQAHITSLAASGNAIGAIKALRKLVNVDLRTAKDAVDQLAAPNDD